MSSMSGCCVAICRNSSGNHTPSDPGVSFVPFPADEALREQWLMSLGISDPDRRFRWKTKSVCSDHFLPYEIHRSDDGIIFPVDGAIPSICGDDEQGNENESNLMLKDHFCRICFRKHRTLFPLSSKIHNMEMMEIIHLVSGLRIENNRLLPSRICSRCMTKVDFAFNVRREFQLNAEKLRALEQENRLLKYYEEFAMEPPEEEAESYSESILRNNREALVDRQVIDADGAFQDLGIVVTGDAEVDCIVEEHLIEQDPGKLEYEEIWNDEATLESNADKDIPITLNDSEPLAPKEKQNYIFSWTELVKPKEEQNKDPKPTEEVPTLDLIPNSCYICNHAFASEQVLEEHLATHAGMLPHKCEQCSTKTNPIISKGIISLNQHLKTHLFPYPCPNCPLKFPSLYSRRSHVRWTHRGFHKNGFTCETCGNVFDKKRTFLAHVLKHRTAEEQRFKCDHCGKIFTTKASLRRHVRTHTGECPFECQYCGKRFNHEYNFRQHKLLHVAGNKIHQCEHCPKGFVNATSLRYHMAEHFPDDPSFRVHNPKATKDQIDYACLEEDCAFVGGNYGQLAYHRNTRHLGKFRCESCSRQFSSNSALQEHEEVVHRGAPSFNRYPCTFCDKTFAIKTRLDQHEDIHRGQKNHFCRFCGKGFIQKVNCVVHERIHTKEQPYRCGFCEMTFFDSRGRKKHEKDRHSQEIVVKTKEPVFRE
ncbi:zinc finger protein 14-like [Ochlerotatus camptorhynchus]|uniref:zinc finger protein 14-like n=1 Tax=Ochlerotatus camptorhynchus TaxID=644619 RepID=UPI0031DEEFFB